MENSEKRNADADCLNWLAAEMRGWTAEGLIKPNQEQWILARYGLMQAETPRSLRQIPLIHLFTAFGALLIGVGVLLMVGYHWQALPRMARLLLLMAPTAGFYAGGYHLAYNRNSYPGVGKALIFLGSILWGSSIFLVAQMFQAGGEGEEFQGVMYWFLGVLPLAYILRSPLQMTLAVVLGLVWVFMHSEGPLGLMNGPHSSLLMMITLGSFLTSVSLLHRDWDYGKSLAPVLHRFGIACAAFGLWGLGFKDIWTFGGFGMETVKAPWIWFLPPLVMSLALAAYSAWKARDTDAKWEAGACALLAVVAAGTLTLFPLREMAPGDTLNLLLVTVYNVLLIGLALGLVWLGTKRYSAGMVNAGMAVFVLHGITRYFDLFGNMLNTGAAFVVAGLILLGGGYVLE